MKYPRAFRNTLLAHFEKTKKKIWTKDEVSMKIMELWLDLPKRTTPVKSKKRKMRPGMGPKAGIPLKNSVGGTGEMEGSDVPELAGDN